MTKPFTAGVKMALPREKNHQAKGQGSDRGGDPPRTPAPQGWLQWRGGSPAQVPLTPAVRALGPGTCAPLGKAERGTAGREGGQGPAKAAVLVRHTDGAGGTCGLGAICHHPVARSTAGCLCSSPVSLVALADAPGPQHLQLLLLQADVVDLPLELHGEGAALAGVHEARLVPCSGAEGICCASPWQPRAQRGHSSLAALFMSQAKIINSPRACRCCTAWAQPAGAGTPGSSRPMHLAQARLVRPPAAPSPKHALCSRMAHTEPRDA